MSEQVDTFLAITGSSDSNIAENFLEMAGGDLETAISLFFEHGPSIGSTNNNNISDNNNNNSNNVESTSLDIDDDAALAERLQNEAYSQQQAEEYSTRAPDEAVHETLVGDDAPIHFFPGYHGGIGGAFNALLNHREGNPNGQIYGTSRVGIFNQRDDQDMMDVSDEDDDRLYEVDSDGEPIERQETTEQKLAKLFRPPYSIMEKLDLNNAKTKARQEKKWLLINIQDNSNFQCHALNRDFWSSYSVKEIVREYFIFLQYTEDSRNGQEYKQFYQFEEYPHIAILDPITGERLKMWSEIPNVSDWIKEVEEFLAQFSLDKGTINPIVEHKKKIDPTSLTEEQQLEYAINQSLSKKDENDVHDVKIVTPEEDEPRELTEEDIIKNIEPISIPDATEGEITRVQIRTGDGKRIVHKFKLDDKVLVIYQFVKANFEQVNNNDTFFTLTSQRDNLFSKIDETIGDAGLKSASILLEIQS